MAPTVGLETSRFADLPKIRNELAPTESVRVDASTRELVSAGPSGLQNAPVDLARAEALAMSVAALLGAGLTSQARPLADELVEVLKAARGPLASVTSLASRRAPR